MGFPAHQPVTSVRPMGLSTEHVLPSVAPALASVFAAPASLLEFVLKKSSAAARARWAATPRTVNLGCDPCAHAPV